MTPMTVLAAVALAAHAVVPPAPRTATTPPMPSAPVMAAAPTAAAAPALATTPPAMVPPAPWAAQDPADSMYRAGRRALNRNDYRAAADQFREIRRRYPRSTYTPDAYYWQAFALYRIGGTS